MGSPFCSAYHQSSVCTRRREEVAENRLSALWMSSECTNCHYVTSYPPSSASVLSASHVHKVKVHSFILQWQKHISKKQYITGVLFVKCECCYSSPTEKSSSLGRAIVAHSPLSRCLSSFILTFIVYRQELPPPRHFFRICHFPCPHHYHCMMTAARNQKISLVRPTDTQSVSLRWNKHSSTTCLHT